MNDDPNVLPGDVISRIDGWYLFGGNFGGAFDRSELDCVVVVACSPRKECDARGAWLWKWDVFIVTQTYVGPARLYR